MGGSGGAATDAGSIDPPPADAGNPPASGVCEYTPKANATQLKLKFKKLDVAGVPANAGARGGGYANGLTEFRFVPGAANEFLMMQKSGRIAHYRLEGNSATMVGVLSGLAGVETNEDCGSLSMAFDPDFATNRLMYVGLCTGNTASVLRRYKWEGTQLSDGQTILTFNSGGAGRSWHSVGSMGFDANKNLWMLHGEFNAGAPAQNLGSTLGKLIRVVPNRQAGMGGFQPAEGNPMAGMGGTQGALYAWGLRSPWRGWLDAKGRYIIGDVQNTNNEEVNVAVRPGQNFGHAGCNGGNCTNALIRWDNGNDPYLGQGDEAKEGRQGRVVWIGAQYGDCGNDKYGGAMTGVQTFGDFFTGWVRGMVLDEGNNKTKDAHLGTLGTISSWDQNKADGYLYLTKFGQYHQGADGEQAGFYRVCQDTDNSPACM